MYKKYQPVRVGSGEFVNDAVFIGIAECGGLAVIEKKQNGEVSEEVFQDDFVTPVLDEDGNIFYGNAEGGYFPATDEYDSEKVVFCNDDKPQLWKI